MTEPTGVVTAASGATVPRAAAGLHVRDLPDGTLVVDPRRVRAHALNPSAAWVFAACDGVADIDAIVGDLVEAADRPRLDLDRDVREVVDHLVHEGVLTVPGIPRAPDEPDHRFTNVPHTGRPARPSSAPPAFTSPRHTGLDFHFRFRTDDLDLAAYLGSILAPLLDPRAAAPTDAPTDAPEADADTEEHVYDLRLPDGPDDPGLLALDGFVVSEPGTAHLLAATVLWHLNQMVSTTSHTRWQLHASGIVRDGRAIVFPASMNSGKSTLVAGLLRAGNAYLTDETIAIDPVTTTVVPYPKAIALDPGSWPVLPDLEPPVAEAWRRFEHQKWHVDPRTTGAAIVARHERPPVGAIILPNYRAGEPTALEPLGPTEAAVELCRNSFNLAALGPAGIDAVVALVQHVPCHRLVVGDLDAAVHLIHDHVDHLTRTPADPAN